MSDLKIQLASFIAEISLYILSWILIKQRNQWILFVTREVNKKRNWIKQRTHTFVYQDARKRENVSKERAKKNRPIIVTKIIKYKWLTLIKKKIITRQLHNCQQ